MMSHTLHHRHNIHRPRVCSTRGTTLIEMLLYLGIVSVLLVGVGTVSMSALDARSKSRAVSAVYAGGTTALAGVRSALESNAVILTPQFGVSSTTLELAASQSSTTTTRIFIAGEQLMLLDGSDALFPLTSNDVRASNIMFTAMGAAGTSTSVTVTLTLAASSTALLKSYQYAETFTSTYVIGGRQ